jgi:hypothetical protein
MTGAAATAEAHMRDMGDAAAAYVLSQGKKQGLGQQRYGQVADPAEVITSSSLHP